ncbi:hypothetical protein BH23VER1_BH23VER1_37120 [soil metagenome]
MPGDLAPLAGRAGPPIPNQVTRRARLFDGGN